MAGNTAFTRSAAGCWPLTPPSSGRAKGRFAPFGPPLMSNVGALPNHSGYHMTRGLLTSLLLAFIALANLAHAETYQLSGQTYETTWSKKGSWNGNFSFPKVYCATAPSPENAERLIVHNNSRDSGVGFLRVAASSNHTVEGTASKLVVPSAGAPDLRRWASQ